MKYSFNLVDEPWVPCIMPNGTLQELSLRDVLAHAHTLRELGGETPLVNAALYRLLLAVVHHVFGPGPGETPDSWADLWERGAWDSARLDAYWAKWRHRFDLFDPEHPFYQREHPKASPKSVISLIYELASGNNPAFFDHHTEEVGATLSPAEAARAVITAQAFGLGGLSPVSGERFTDGPAARGITFLVKGDTLFQTLMLNLLPYPDTETFAHHTKDRDCPAWAMEDPFQPDRGIPFGYLDYLTWQNRRILLLPECDAEGRVVVRTMKLGPGLRLDASVMDPLKHYHGSPKTGWRVLRFQEDRALWRDSAAVLNVQAQKQVDYSPGKGEEVNHPPRPLVWLAVLIEAGIAGLTRQQTRRLLALGMANDQAKVEFYRREELPLPLALLEDRNLAKHLEIALGKAENVSQQSQEALRTLAVQFLFHKNKTTPEEREERDRLLKAWGAERHYWAALEIPFYDLVTNLPQDAHTANDAWEKALRSAAREAFEAVAENLGEDPLTLKAIVLARGQLEGGLAKALNE